MGFIMALNVRPRRDLRYYKSRFFQQVAAIHVTRGYRLAKHTRPDSWHGVQVTMENVAGASWLAGRGVIGFFNAKQSGREEKLRYLQDPSFRYSHDTD